MAGSHDCAAAQQCACGQNSEHLACDEARGKIVAHFDDDDWYGCGRLAAAVPNRGSFIYVRHGSTADSR